MKTTPLQTHGKTVERWVPPVSAFVQYEQSDAEMRRRSYEYELRWSNHYKAPRCNN